jgi:uncharacterized protein involved in type VI secretion and phage assembly
VGADRKPSAGDGRGLMMMPLVGDEVLIASSTTTSTGLT